MSPGQRLYLSKLVADGQSLIEELPVLATGDTPRDEIETLRTDKKTRLFCTDIAY